MKVLFQLTLVSALLALQACATGPNANPQDPLEPLNRSMFRFNEAVDDAVLKPVSTVYRDAVPEPVRNGVGNFFANLSDMWSFVNTLFQCKPKEAGENLMRVGVNTLFGLGGIFDVATDLNIERHKEDFGQTLGYWGLGSGPYVVLPFFGPSTLRDTAALVADVPGDPVVHVTPVPDRNALYLLRTVDTRANLLALSSVVDEVALDKYSFTRDAYLQRRRSLIHDGLVPEEQSEQSQAPASTEQATTPEPQTEPASQKLELALASIYAE